MYILEFIDEPELTPVSLHAERNIYLLVILWIEKMSLDI